MPVITPAANSFEDIKKDLIAYVKTRPDADKWLDMLESGIGTTILELIAGLGAFKSFKEVMRQRESLLELAQAKSNVYELAFNRGYLMPPMGTAEVILTITPDNDGAIDKGDGIAYSMDYTYYALEDVQLFSGIVVDVRCCVGIKSVLSKDMSAIGKFQTVTFELPAEYPASQLESCKIDGVETILTADIPSDTIVGDFLLRRAIPFNVKLYTGNGKLGWYSATASSMEYTILAYGNDLKSLLNISPSLFIVGNLEEFSVVRYPEYPTTDSIKKNAIYFPLDGRIVRDQDYEMHILKYWSSAVVDVYAYNSDPTENVFILKGENWTDEILVEITNSVDAHRAMGMQVAYTVLEREDLVYGKELMVVFRVPTTVFTSGVAESMQVYLDERAFKFCRSETEEITTNSLAVELTNHLGFLVYPGDDTVLTLNRWEFLRSINFTLELF